MKNALDGLLKTKPRKKPRKKTKKSSDKAGLSTVEYLNMERLVFGHAFLFSTICGIVTAVGLDLKKLSSWLWGIYGFLTGPSLSLFS